MRKFCKNAGSTSKNLVTEMQGNDTTSFQNVKRTATNMASMEFANTNRAKYAGGLSSKNIMRKFVLSKNIFLVAVVLFATCFVGRPSLAETGIELETVWEREVKGMTATSFDFTYFSFDLSSNPDSKILCLKSRYHRRVHQSDTSIDTTHVSMFEIDAVTGDVRGLFHLYPLQTGMWLRTAFIKKHDSTLTIFAYNTNALFGARAYNRPQKITARVGKHSFGFLRVDTIKGTHTQPGLNVNCVTDDNTGYSFINYAVNTKLAALYVGRYIHTDTLIVEHFPCKDTTSIIYYSPLSGYYCCFFEGMNLDSLGIDSENLGLEDNLPSFKQIDDTLSVMYVDVVTFTNSNKNTVQRRHGLLIVVFDKENIIHRTFIKIEDYETLNSDRVYFCNYAPNTLFMNIRRQLPSGEFKTFIREITLYGEIVKETMMPNAWWETSILNPYSSSEKKL